MRNYTYDIKCEKCNTKAGRFCRLCSSSWRCEAHNEDHCNSTLEKISLLIPDSALLEKKQQLEQLSEKIKAANNSLVKDYNSCTQLLMSLFHSHTSKSQQSLEIIRELLLEIEFASRGERILNEPLLALVNKSKIVEEIERKGVKGKNDFAKVYKFMENIENISEIGKNVNKGFLDLPETEQHWKLIKQEAESLDKDAIWDFVNELEDNKTKLLRENLEITTLIARTRIPTLIPYVCPNIKNISIKAQTRELNELGDSIGLYQNLISLKLENSKFQEKLSCSKIFESLKALENLENLSLINIFLSDIELNPRGFKSLKLLELKNNSITSENHKNLFTVIQSSSKLKYLTISSNQLTQNASLNLVNVIQQLNDLEYVSFNRNKIDNTLEKIIRAMKEKNTVVEFQFYMNQISPRALELVVQGLVWGRLVKVVLGFGLEEKLYEQLKKLPFRLLFKNNNLLIEA